MMDHAPLARTRETNVAWRFFMGGRLGAVLPVVAYLAVLGLLYAGGRFQRPWVALGVWQLDFFFGDLQVLLSGIECHGLGLDPLYTNPCDIGGGPGMNYPRIWLALGRLGAGPAWRLPLGFALGGGFLVAIIASLGSLSLWEGLLVGTAICSPSVMLLLERGNIDVVVIAAMLGVAALVASRRQRIRDAGYACLLGAAVLKLYPILGTIAVLRERSWRRMAVRAGAVGVAFLGYAALTWRDLQRIAEMTPRWIGVLTYGCDSMPATLNELFRWQGPRHWIWPAAAILIGSAALGLAMRRVAPAPAWTQAGAPGIAFALGASTYVGTFLLGTNFAYRLAVLLLALPQLLVWARERSTAGRVARVLSGATIVSLYLVPVDRRVLHLWMIGQGASWLLLAGLAFALAAFSGFPEPAPALPERGAA